MDLSTEEAALAAAGCGQRHQALKILMTAYGDAITAVALRVVRDPEVAEDICQQVFLEVFQRISKFKGRSLWCWLCSIAYRRAWMN